MSVVGIVLAAACLLLLTIYIIRRDKIYRRKLRAYHRAQARQSQVANPPQPVPVAHLRAGWQTIATLLELTPAQFGLAVGVLLQQAYYNDVQQEGGAVELGGDLTCRTPNGQLAVVQCKQYRPGHLVGAPDIQACIDTAYTHPGAAKLIFVTTSTFTEEAWVLGQQHNIDLIDGPQLVRLADAAALRGVAAVPPSHKMNNAL